MQSFVPLLFGRFLVKTGWVTDAQIQQATQLQKDLTPNLPLTAVLEGFLTIEELRQVLAYQREHGLLFLEAAKHLGILSEEHLAILESKRQTYKMPIGEALVLQGSLSKEKLEEALAAFEHYKNSGILLPAT